MQHSKLPVNQYFYFIHFKFILFMISLFFNVMFLLSTVFSHWCICNLTCNWRSELLFLHCALYIFHLQRDAAILWITLHRTHAQWCVIKAPHSLFLSFFPPKKLNQWDPPSHKYHSNSRSASSPGWKGYESAIRRCLVKHNGSWRVPCPFWSHHTPQWCN